MVNELQGLFWDFDGVLMNSNETRDMGFELVLNDFPPDEVSKLLEFHRSNGGLSRYVKFRYFFEQIRNERVTDKQIEDYALNFSEIMLSRLLDKQLIIHETINFVKKYSEAIPMHIVSGSDQNELRKICDFLQIKQFFKSIGGSPTPKIELVANILQSEKYHPNRCLMIGDSINDYHAAKDNGLEFMGYNNKEIECLSTQIINLAL